MCNVNYAKQKTHGHLEQLMLKRKEIDINPMVSIYCTRAKNVKHIFTGLNSDLHWIRGASGKAVKI